MKARWSTFCLGTSRPHRDGRLRSPWKTFSLHPVILAVIRINGLVLGILICPTLEITSEKNSTQRDSNPRPSDPCLLASVSSTMMVPFWWFPDYGSLNMASSRTSVSTIVGPHLGCHWPPGDHLLRAVAGILTWTRTTQSVYKQGSKLPSACATETACVRNL